MQAYQLPHSCETEEIAALLAQLSPRQQRVLRAYVWQVELGEHLVSEWLAAEACPVSIKSWYRRGDNAAYWNDGAFRAALDAYLRTGQRWRLNQEQRQVERARTTLIQAVPRAADRVAELVDGDIGQLFKIVERWTEEPLPSQEILEEKVEPHPIVPGAQIRLYRVSQAVIDLTRLSDPRYSRLVKKFSDSPKSGLSIEMHDAIHASESVLDRADMKTATKAEVDNRVTLRVVYDDGIPDTSAEAPPETG